MNRKALESLARQHLYTQAPQLTTHLASRIISSEPFQKWMDSIERRRPRGLVAWVRRLRGKEGITPEQAQELAELARKTVEKIGR